MTDNLRLDVLNAIETNILNINLDTDYQVMFCGQGTNNFRALQTPLRLQRHIVQIVG